MTVRDSARSLLLPATGEFVFKVVESVRTVIQRAGGILFRFSVGRFISSRFVRSEIRPTEQSDKFRQKHSSAVNGTDGNPGREQIRQDRCR